MAVQKKLLLPAVLYKPPNNPFKSAYLTPVTSAYILEDELHCGFLDVIETLKAPFGNDIGNIIFSFQ